MAAVLLLFGSWWLFNTDAVHSVVGDSVGALCLGVVAASILQGMRIPLGLWPDSPWRKRFSVVAVLVTAGILAVSISLFGRSLHAGAEAWLDPGRMVAAVVGSVGLGFGFGFVRQRRLLVWYGIAVGLALVPTALELLFGARAALNLNTLGLLAFFTAVEFPAKLVTEDIAFRRLLIGTASGAGLVSVLGSATIALIWYLVLKLSGVSGISIIWLGAFGAVSAGSIYVLSKSLMVSALFGAVQAAGYLALNVAPNPETVATDSSGAGVITLITTLLVSAGLSTQVFRSNGLLGNLKGISEKDAASS